jgi:YbbR domain-containing protein
MEQKNEKSGVSRNKVLQVIASILVAVAIWVYVDVEKAPERTKTIRDIPVEFSGESTTLADKNLMLLSGYDTTVDLTIKGTKRELVKINKDNVRLVASTSSIDSVGVHTLRWDVVYPDGVQSSALSVDWASKYKVTVTVGELYTKEVPVNCVVTGTVADGYFTGETVLDPTTLVLRGQRDDLLNVAYAKLTVDISDATRSVIQTESVQLYDNDDNPVDNSNIRTNASLIQAKVPVLTTKEVSLAVELSGVPGSAGQSIKTTITPSSVRLIGEADVLENIDEIVLATLYIEDLDIWQQNSYVVTAPDGTWLANSNEVATVEITMEGIEEKTVTVDTFSYTNVPSGLYAEVMDTLDVRLWGLSEELAELKADAITATVDLSSVTETGSCRVPVTVTVSGYRDVAVKGSYEVTVYVTDTQPEPEPEPDGGLTSHGNNGSGNEN